MTEAARELGLSHARFYKLYSHYLGNAEPVTELPLQVKVNCDNGNLLGFERVVLAKAINAPNVQGVVDVTPLLANIVPPKVLVVPRHGPIFPQTLQPYPFPANHSGGSALSIQYTGLFPTREIETFFATYKELESTKVANVKGWHDADVAWRLIEDARSRAVARR